MPNSTVAYSASAQGLYAVHCLAYQSRGSEPAATGTIDVIESIQGIYAAQMQSSPCHIGKHLICSRSTIHQTSPRKLFAQDTSYSTCPTILVMLNPTHRSLIATTIDRSTPANARVNDLKSRFDLRHELKASVPVAHCRRGCTASKLCPSSRDSDPRRKTLCRATPASVAGWQHVVL